MIKELIVRLGLEAQDARMKVAMTTLALVTTRHVYA